MAPRMIDAAEILQHNRPTDLWTVVDGKVYDLTEFAPKHPGGSAIILRHAGKDATKAYAAVHSPMTIIKELDSEKQLGDLNVKTDIQLLSIEPELSKDYPVRAGKAPLHKLINTFDFEKEASKSFAPKTWAYYSSAATDALTHGLNGSTYDQILLRPRILRNVKSANMKTRVLGVDMNLPLFVSPVAMCKLAHRDGEIAVSRACATQGIVQCISSNASYSIDEIIDAVPEGNPFFFQHYVNELRSKTEELLRKLDPTTFRAIFLTVDAPVTGKREADERFAVETNTKGGFAKAMGSYIDSSLCWDDLVWLRSITSIPIVLKGIQTAADAKKAADYGCAAIVLSNHGGRSLDTSPPSILVLLELQRCCPEVFDKMEIFIDGGIRRGTDIFKALCLGATAVGVGRGILYSLQYGEEGVTKYIQILKDELETTMKMVGITDLSQASAALANSSAVDHLVPLSENHPYAKKRRRSML